MSWHMSVHMPANMSITSPTTWLPACCVHVFIPIHVYTCIRVYAYVHSHAYTPVCLNTCIPTYLAQMSTHMSILVQTVQVFVHTYEHMSTRMLTHAFVYMSTQIYVYMPIRRWDSGEVLDLCAGELGVWHVCCTPRAACNVVAGTCVSASHVMHAHASLHSACSLHGRATGRRTDAQTDARMDGQAGGRAGGRTGRQAD